MYEKLVPFMYIPKDGTLIESRDLSRRELRVLTLSLLYAIDVADYSYPLSRITDHVTKLYHINITQQDELVHNLMELINERNALDHLLEPFFQNWRPERVNLITRLILRIALWELKTKHLSPRITINEAVELARCFASEDAYRFINGILDAVIKTMPELGLQENADSLSEQEA
ncbi:MAG: transcription antitermination factor NusB [Candidatus Babeliales bacterium]